MNELSDEAFEQWHISTQLSDDAIGEYSNSTVKDKHDQYQQAYADGVEHGMFEARRRVQAMIEELVLKHDKDQTAFLKSCQAKYVEERERKAFEWAAGWNGVGTLDEAFRAYLEQKQ